MTTSYFKELASYNLWANNTVFNWLNNITEEQWNKEVESSFKSLALTCIHIAGAEKIWLERFTNIENPIFLFNEFKGNKKELISIWQKASSSLKIFIDNINQDLLHQTFSFTRLNGDVEKMLYWKAFAHVFNHSSYHRGQVVTLLRNVGFKDISSTDYLAFTRL